MKKLILCGLLLASPLSFGAHSTDYVSQGVIQKIVTQLQRQIAKVQSLIPTAISQQQKVTQASLEKIQQATQKQLSQILPKVTAAQNKSNRTIAVVEESLLQTQKQLQTMQGQVQQLQSDMTLVKAPIDYARTGSRR